MARDEGGGQVRSATQAQVPSMKQTAEARKSPWPSRMWPASMRRRSSAWSRVMRACTQSWRKRCCSREIVRPTQGSLWPKFPSQLRRIMRADQQRATGRQRLGDTLSEPECVLVQCAVRGASRSAITSTRCA
jgi:hypothetical protein